MDPISLGQTPASSLSHGESGGITRVIVVCLLDF
jgi:hypothetical protein